MVWGHHQAAENPINQLRVRSGFRVGKQNAFPGCKSFYRESGYKARQEKALTVNTRCWSPQPSLLSSFLPISLKRRRVRGRTVFKASLNKEGDFYKRLCFLRCRQEPASSPYCHPIGKLFRYLWQPQHPSQRTSSSKILPLIFTQDIGAFLLHKSYLLVTECAYKVDNNENSKLQWGVMATETWQQDTGILLLVGKDDTQVSFKKEWHTWQCQLRALTVHILPLRNTGTCWGHPAWQKTGVARGHQVKHEPVMWPWGKKCPGLWQAGLVCCVQYWTLQNKVNRDRLKRAQWRATRIAKELEYLEKSRLRGSHLCI